jgi:hypothetical protein
MVSLQKTVQFTIGIQDQELESYDGYLNGRGKFYLNMIMTNYAYFFWW